jgi:hypothetical protein
MTDAEELSRQAQHEAGHAAARWAQSLPILGILLDPPGPLTLPPPGAVLNVGQSWLVAACGAIADYQRRGLRMRDDEVPKLLMGSDGDMFELDDAEGNVAERVSRLPAIGERGDLREMTARMAAEGWPVPELVRIWRDCELVAASCRPAIDGLAAELVGRRQIPGDQALRICGAAMAGKRAPEIPAWARDPAARLAWRRMGRSAHPLEH